MTTEGTKPLCRDAAAPDELREFVALARADGPSQADLDRLAARLSSALDDVGKLEAPHHQAEAMLGSPPAEVVRPSTVPTASARASLAKLLSSPYAKVVAAISLAVAIGLSLAPRRAPSPVPAGVPAAQGLSAKPRPDGSPKQTVEPAPAHQEAEAVKSAAASPAEQTLALAQPASPQRSARRAARNTASTKPAREASARTEPARETASELELIVKAEASRAEPARALALLTLHERLYPRGTLVQEREVLAVEALLRAGEIERAKTRANRFERTFPGSAHQPRLRALFARTNE